MTVQSIAPKADSFMIEEHRQAEQALRQSEKM
jgi:hypothetical protein